MKERENTRDLHTSTELPSYSHPQNDNERESNTSYLNQLHSRQVSTNTAVDTFRLDPQAVRDENKPLGSSRVPDYRNRGGSREELQGRGEQEWKSNTGTQDNFMYR